MKSRDRIRRPVELAQRLPIWLGISIAWRSRRRSDASFSERINFIHRAVPHEPVQIDPARLEDGVAVHPSLGLGVVEAEAVVVEAEVRHELLAAEAVGVGVLERAGAPGLPAVRVVAVLRQQGVAGVHQGGDVAAAVGVVGHGAVEDAAATLVLVAAAEQPADAAGALERAGQVRPAAVGDHGHVAPVALLDQTILSSEFPHS